MAIAVTMTSILAFGMGATKPRKKAYAPPPTPDFPSCAASPNGTVYVYRDTEHEFIVNWRCSGIGPFGCMISAWGFTEFLDPQTGKWTVIPSSRQTSNMQGGCGQSPFFLYGRWDNILNWTLLYRMQAGFEDMSSGLSYGPFISPQFRRNDP